MAYGFNEDKTKANLSDQFAIFSYDFETMSIAANRYARLTTDPELEQEYPAAEYVPVAVLALYTDTSYANLTITEWQFMTLSGANKFNFVVRNLTGQNETFKAHARLLLMKK